MENGRLPLANQSFDHLDLKFSGCAVQKALARLGLYQPLRPPAIGIVHGVASSAAVALRVLTQSKIHAGRAFTC